VSVSTFGVKILGGRAGPGERRTPGHQLAAEDPVPALDHRRQHDRIADGSTFLAAGRRGAVVAPAIVAMVPAVGRSLSGNFWKREIFRLLRK